MLLIAAESMTLTPFLIQSVPCDKGVAGCGKDGSGEYKLRVKYVLELTRI